MKSQKTKKKVSLVSNNKAYTAYRNLFESAVKNFDQLIEDERNRNFYEMKRKFAGHF